MKQILCLSNEPWSSSPGRTQQLAVRLKDVRILYFSPAVSRRDQGFRTRGQRVRPNVTAYTLPPISFPVPERYRFLFRRSWDKIARFIQSVTAQNRFSRPLLWTTHPRHIHLLDRLDYNALVYDCDREWDGTPPGWEGSLANAADVVFAASPQLCDRLSPCSANIALLPNGVNYPLFSSGDARSDPLPGLRGPVLGRVGTLWEDLDLSPLVYAARSRPEWTFLLLGRQEDNQFLPQLRQLPNVLFQKPCSLSAVPDWLYRCDILTDFLRLDRPYDDVIPTRMYEYLATGKPVVSMLWPDQVEQFPDVVYGAHDPQEFVTLCSHALEEAPGFVSQRRQNHARSAAWSSRAGQVTRILETAGLL